MSRRLKDKYRRYFIFNQAGILGGTVDDVAEEKLIKVRTGAFEVGTLVYVEARTKRSQTWDKLEELAGGGDKIIDISLYDEIRYNVFSYTGTPSYIEAVSAVESDANLIGKDSQGRDALRVIQESTESGDEVSALLSALVTMQFWQLTNFDVSTLDFVSENDGGPIVDNQGNFVII